MLEAMMSSRWSYERSQAEAIGGRFFTPDFTPGYKDIEKLTGEFQEWLISRAKVLPEEMMLDVPLQYND